MQMTTSSGSAEQEKTLICTSVTADSKAAFLAEIGEATAAGVDLLELRLDFLKDLDVSRDLEEIMKACTIPYIVTFRPAWEG